MSVVEPASWLLWPDATAVLNSPGDTSLDSVVVSAGSSGTVVLVNSNLDWLPLLTPEFAYGLVFDTVGCGAVNLTVVARLGVSTSEYSGYFIVVGCTTVVAVDISVEFLICI